MSRIFNPCGSSERVKPNLERTLKNTKQGWRYGPMASFVQCDPFRVASNAAPAKRELRILVLKPKHLLMHSQKCTCMMRAANSANPIRPIYHVPTTCTVIACENLLERTKNIPDTLTILSILC
jgi:hypothetical protein